MATTTKKKADESASEEIQAEAAADVQTATEREGVFCYIGPNIPGVITEGTICTGTSSGIRARYAAAIEKWPQIASLIVPVESLADSRRDAKTNGTLLHEKYVALLSTK